MQVALFCRQRRSTSNCNSAKPTWTRACRLNTFTTWHPSKLCWKGVATAAIRDCDLCLVHGHWQPHWFDVPPRERRAHGDLINHEKAVRTMIEKVQGQVGFGSWKDLQKAPCDFTSSHSHQAEENSATIDKVVHHQHDTPTVKSRAG